MSLARTFRSLFKNRSYGLLNIAGLAIGIACATLIFLWIEDEIMYNHYFTNRNSLYQVMENQSFNGAISTVRVTPGPLAGAMKSEIPGIRNTSRMSGGHSQSLFAIGEKAIYENGNYVDSSFFSLFDLNFVKGDAHHAFDQVHSLVITEAMARRFFAEADPLGQTLKMDNEALFTVTGVIKSLPENTSFSLDWLAPFELLMSRYPWIDRWDANGIITYAELQDGIDPASVNERLSGFLKTKKPGIDAQCFLFGMPDWRLYDHFSNGHQDEKGQIKYVRLFTLIASLILIIACVNFMNLATARSEQRAKEVGVRKTLGAGRKGLVFQFIGEALILSGMAVVLAVLVVFLSLPLFNGLVDKHLELDLLNPIHTAGLAIAGMVCGLLAGSYPAFYLSAFNPVHVLKGLRIKSGISAALIRKGLVTAQFIVSITLIICTIIMDQQVRHTKDRDLGYNKQGVLYMDVRGKTVEHFDAIKTSLINSGAIENAALSMNPTFQFGWFSGDNYTWQGKDPGKDILIMVEGATSEYVATMGLKIREGRDFLPDAKNDLNNVLINESMAKLMGNGSPIGNTITQKSDQPVNEWWKMKVVGVVEDFVFGNVFGTKAEPMILTCNPVPYKYMTLRLKPGADLKTSLARIEKVMRGHNPEYPFDYRFLDDEFNKLFKTETLVEKLSGVFASLAIFISCIGLFGLAAYTATRRTKEISIRKILGATAAGLTGLLSRDFLQLVLVACIVSFPASWWIMSQWLSSYEYQTPIHWWVFVVTGFVALMIALLTVSFQTIKAAFVNPVNSLRRE